MTFDGLSWVGGAPYPWENHKENGDLTNINGGFNGIWVADL